VGGKREEGWLGRRRKDSKGDPERGSEEFLGD